MSRAVAMDTAGFQMLLGKLRQAFTAAGYLRVQWSDSKPRSLPQNRLLHSWIGQISRELGEETPEGVKCEIKLRLGVPILRADDDEFCAAYDSAIKPMPYERKLIAMRYWPVTSLMNTAQLTRLLDDVQREYAQRHVVLCYPDEYLTEAGYGQ